MRNFLFGESHIAIRTAVISSLLVSMILGAANIFLKTGPDLALVQHSLKLMESELNLLRKDFNKLEDAKEEVELPLKLLVVGDFTMQEDDSMIGALS